MSVSNTVEIIIQPNHTSVLKGVTHAAWQQFLKFELLETGTPPVSGRLVGKGMKGEYMDVDKPGGGKQMTFEAAQCARTLKLTATHKADGATEEKASKLFKNEVPHGNNPISVLFAEDGGSGAKDIDYNDIAASVYQFKG